MLHITLADDGRGINALTLGGFDAASFEIVGTSLYLKAGVALNFEAKTSYTVTVSATDASVAGSTLVTAVFTLSITDANETPIDLTLSPASVAENAPVGSPVGVLLPADPDAGETSTYALVSGTGSADNAWFELAGSALRTRAVFDYETRNSYSIRVRVTDAGGLAFEKAFTIAVTNVNEPPTAVALSIPDSTPTATNVKLADIAVIDDGLGSNVLTLSGADAGSFQVIGSVLYLKAGTSLNAQTKPSYVVTVAAADASLPGTAPVSTTYTLTIVPSGIVVDAGATVTDTAVRVGDFRLVKQGGGTLILDKANTHSGGTVIEAGEVIVRNVDALGTGTITVAAGAKLTLQVGYGSINVASLALDQLGKLDVGTGIIRVAANGFDTATIRILLKAGRNTGNWDGATGIMSATASHLLKRAVGYRVSGGVLTLAWAAFGDLNLDGRVNSTDLSLFTGSGKYNKPVSNAEWFQGDLNYDGRINSTDLSLFTSSGLYNKASYRTGSGTTGLAAATDAPLATAPDSAALQAAFAALIDPDTTTAKSVKRRSPTVGLPKDVSS